MNKLTFPEFLVLPTIEESADISFKYHIDWYDGPLEGLLTYLSDFYWFFLVYEDWEPRHNDFEFGKRHRWFVLFEPTKEQLDFHNYWHEKFEYHEKTGTLDTFYNEYRLVKGPPFTYSQAKYFMIE